MCSIWAWKSGLCLAHRPSRPFGMCVLRKVRRSVMNSMAIEVLTPRYGIAWYPWAVQYFFMIAVSYSALLLTVPGLIFGNKNYQPLAKVALLVTVKIGRASCRE